MLLTHISGLLSPLITSHEPPSTSHSGMVLRTSLVGRQPREGIEGRWAGLQGFRV